jgi:hypothetical protein
MRIIYSVASAGKDIARAVTRVAYAHFATTCFILTVMHVDCLPFVRGATKCIAATARK